MASYVYVNGFHYTGKFSELVSQLAAIENKQMTLAEYISSYRRKLN